MRIFLLSLLFLFSILLEGAITTFPLTLLLLFSVYVFTRGTWIFMIAFISGFFLDILSFKTPGTSSLLFLSFIFILTLYERKFELRTINFVLISCFLGSFLYLIILGYNYALLQAVISSLMAVLFFKICYRSEKRKMLIN